MRELRGKGIASWSEQEITQAMRLYSELKATDRVAVEMGVAPETVRKVLRRQGVQLRSISKPVTPEQIKRFGKLKQAGWTINAIAREVGVASDTVTRHLKRAVRNVSLTEKEAPPSATKHFREAFGAEPLSAGHSIAMRGLWRGLERWRGLSA